MRNKFPIVTGIILTVSVVALIIGCTGSIGPKGEIGPPGPAGPIGPTGPVGAIVSCTQCHNDTQLITAKHLQWSESRHATGDAYNRGTSASCAGCHAGQGFSDRIKLGLDPDEVELGIPAPTGQNCRTCHQIHTTFTGEDFTLETTEPVTFFATNLEGTYDSGDGNLCANCHQPRRTLADYPAVDGVINVNSSHFGPHHGVEAVIFLGLGSNIEGNPGGHYLVVEDGCVTCHLGPDDNHTFEPQLAVCQGCHGKIDDFNINETQTEIKKLLEEIEVILEVKGMIEPGSVHTTIIGNFPEEDVKAMWNYLLVHEDQSHGVHNPRYTKSILEVALETLQQ
jgi:hypothetical protein